MKRLIVTMPLLFALLLVAPVSYTHLDVYKRQMQHTLEEVQYKAISAMVLKLWREYGNELRITGLRDAFKGGTIEELGVVGDQRIKDLAIMLNPYRCV